MKIKTYIITLFTLLFISQLSNAQDGKIIERNKIDVLQNEELKNRIWDEFILDYKSKYRYLSDVIIEEITYLSDGLKVKGYMAYPKTKATYPGIIYNRGGNKEFGSLNEFKAVFILARLASWGYVVAASQYRGNNGGEGKEEFGGKDVNDVLNLIPLLANTGMADTSKLGIYGWSRGGMMTYLTLTKTNQFKAAAVGGAVSDLQMVMDTRKDTFETVYQENIPNYSITTRDELLAARSAIKQVEKISKTTPILMMHGTADWRVVPQMALELSSEFIKHDVPHRLIIFEGGDHGLREFGNEVDKNVKNWFDKYIKHGKELPDLKPHGR